MALAGPSAGIAGRFETKSAFAHQASGGMDAPDPRRVRFRNRVEVWVVERFDYHIMRKIKASPLSKHEACAYCKQCQED